MSQQDHVHGHGHASSPTAILVEEHALILQALDALEPRLDSVAQGGSVERTYFEKVVAFLRTFADACHHGKEERLLFEHMVQALGFPRHAGPIAAMLADHAAGRGYVRGMAEAIAQLGADPDAAPRLVQNGRQYIQLLRSHIQRENTILFPMAEARMGAPDRAQLAAAFERFETEETGMGVHEGAVTLLAELTAAA